MRAYGARAHNSAILKYIILNLIRLGHSKRKGAKREHQGTTIYCRYPNQHREHLPGLA
ncbi:MAG: hypothetical protein RugAbin2_00304 [Rugosibacter sp.]|jgi:hypothetical protein|nr:hypothetical protein [Rugosibacter sp.]